MTRVFLYGEVDLPQIPLELLVSTDGMPAEKYVHDIGYGQSFEKSGIKKKNCAYAKWVVNHQPLIDWIKATVPVCSDLELLTIQKNIPDGTDTDTLFPVHHDVKRMFALNYIISTGGNNVITSWYRDTNQALVRSLNKPIGVQSDSGPVDYSQCELLGSMCSELGRWYLIRTNVLHDVDHMDSERSSVTIPYFDDSILRELEQRKLFKSIKEVDNDSR